MAGTPSPKGRPTKLKEVGKDLAYEGVPMQYSHHELNALHQREIMEDILHYRQIYDQI